MRSTCSTNASYMMEGTEIIQSRGVVVGEADAIRLLPYASYCRVTVINLDVTCYDLLVFLPCAEFCEILRLFMGPPLTEMRKPSFDPGSSDSIGSSHDVTLAQQF